MQSVIHALIANDPARDCACCDARGCSRCHRTVLTFEGTDERRNVAAAVRSGQGRLGEAPTVFQRLLLSVFPLYIGD